MTAGLESWGERSLLHVLRKGLLSLPSVLKAPNQGPSKIHLCVKSTHVFTTEKLLWINISDVQPHVTFGSG